MVNKASRNAGNVPVFYYERQRGGLCRLHAINAFLGSAIYSEAQFNDEMDKFDVSTFNDTKREQDPNRKDMKPLKAHDQNLIPTMYPDTKNNIQNSIDDFIEKFNSKKIVFKRRKSNKVL